MTRVRQQPCEACPYRRDVPSGVWSAEEYAKLPPYDKPTGEQPLALFACHATPKFACHGWAVVHNKRGGEYELLAYRFFIREPVPEPTVPLFESGLEAAEHGMRNIKRPTRKAKATMSKLLQRYGRLKTLDSDDIQT